MAPTSCGRDNKKVVMVADVQVSGGTVCSGTVGNVSTVRRAQFLSTTFTDNFLVLIAFVWFKTLLFFKNDSKTKVTEWSGCFGN